jgi:REP element-mobilizing transposase RayT
MSTFTQILYHIIWTTKHRKPSLLKEDQPSLFAHINRLFIKRKCYLYEINSTEDHIHILAHIHPSIALANLVKTLKLSGTKHIKDNSLFPGFPGWQDGYVAFTHSIRAKGELTNFIKNQQTKHMAVSYIDELIALLKEHEIPFDEMYLL